MLRKPELYKTFLIPVSVTVLNYLVVELVEGKLSGEYFSVAVARLTFAKNIFKVHSIVTE